MRYDRPPVQVEPEQPRVFEPELLPQDHRPAPDGDHGHGVDQGSR